MADVGVGSMFSYTLLEQAGDLLAMCRERGWRMAVAESCTGGLISALVTEIPGSSDVFERGFVTYHNEAKVEMLGVKPGILKKHGAVSEEVAVEMAEGALSNSGADISVAVTGIAGPGGGTKTKPVGLVHIASSSRQRARTIHSAHNFSGSREEIRLAAVEEALELMRMQIL